MRKIGKEPSGQLPVRSTPEIVAHVKLAVYRLALTERCDGEALRPSHLMNAVALWMARADPEEFRAWVVPKLRDYERYIREEIDVDTPIGTPSAAPARGGGGRLESRPSAPVPEPDAHRGPARVEETGGWTATGKAVIQKPAGPDQVPVKNRRPRRRA